MNNEGLSNIAVLRSLSDISQHLLHLKAQVSIAKKLVIRPPNIFPDSHSGLLLSHLSILPTLDHFPWHPQSTAAQAQAAFPKLG